jgi:hypothetical protein
MKHFKDSLKADNGSFVYPVYKSPEYYKFQELIHDFSDDVTHSLSRQFLNEESHTPIRLSSIGKTPAFEMLAKKLNLLPMGSKRTVPESLRLIFSLGDWFETYLLFTLERMGYEIKETQTLVECFGVTGHIDAVVIDPIDKKEHLLEIKSANEWYFSSCVRRGYPMDDRGYLTQLLTYSKSLNIPHDRTHWIMWNKNTGDIEVMDLCNVPSDLASSRLRRAEAISRAYANCSELKDLYASVKPPPPRIEKTKDGKAVLDANGLLKLYPPPEVSHASFCYVLEQGKTKWGKARTYVKDYNYPEEFQSYKPKNIIQDAIHADEVYHV